MRRLDHDRCCRLAQAEVGRLADVLRGIDLSRPVPTCPEWDLAELARHAGSVHRWATEMVERTSSERLSREDMPNLGIPDDAAGLPDWLAAGAGPMADVFGACDPDAGMWAWGADPHARFWPRRMVHETGIHRADAELAVGVQPAFDPEVAADGIDELLDNLPHAAYFAPKVSELCGEGESLVLSSPDAGWWRIDLQPDGFVWSTGEESAPKATATVTAPAAELLLVVYGRQPPGAVAGDAALLERWLTNSAL